MIKQVIVVRTDLNMRKGKMCAQAAHASMEFLRDRLGDWHQLINRHLKGNVRLRPVEFEWLTGDRTKVVVQGRDLRHLIELQATCKLTNVLSYMMVDQGRTDVEPGTTTALAIGPAESEFIDRITGDLPLL